MTFSFCQACTYVVKSVLDVCVSILFTGAGDASSQSGIKSLWTHSCNYLLSEFLIRRAKGFNFFELVCLLEFIFSRSAFFFLFMCVLFLCICRLLMQ